MNPYVRIVLRAVLVALGAGLASINEARDGGISQDELISAGYAAYVGLSAYVTAAVFTDLEPTLGVKS